MKNCSINNDYLYLEFDSYEDKLQYEKEREEYYMSCINDMKHYGWIYFELRELFSKKRKELKKKYNHYLGGYWIDKDTGYIYTNDPVELYKELYKYPKIGNIIIQVYDGGYQPKIYSRFHDMKGFVQIK